MDEPQYTFTLFDLQRGARYFDGDAQASQVLRDYLRVLQVRKDYEMEQAGKTLQRQREDEERRLSKPD